MENPNQNDSMAEQLWRKETPTAATGAIPKTRPRSEATLPPMEYYVCDKSEYKRFNVTEQYLFFAVNGLRKNQDRYKPEEYLEELHQLVDQLVGAWLARVAKSSHKKKKKKDAGGLFDPTLVEEPTQLPQSDQPDPTAAPEVIYEPK